MTESAETHTCDVTVCTQPAVHCYVGEAGETWVCADHLKPIAVKATTFAEVLTYFLEGYDLGKLDDPSLRTSDITRDLLALPDIRAIKTALHRLEECEGAGWLDHLDLPRLVIEWVMS